MVEIIPKPAEKAPLWLQILSDFLIFLLIGVIISYFALGWLEKKSENYLQNLEEKISQARTPEIIALEKEVLDYQKKIEDFAKIFEQHKLNSKFFQFLEERTYPKVFFSKFNLNSQTLKVSLSGQADNFLSLGYQLQILEKEPLLKEINLSKISLAREGGIEFDLELILNPKMLSW